MQELEVDSITMTVALSQSRSMLLAHTVLLDEVSVKRGVGFCPENILVNERSL